MKHKPRMTIHAVPHGSGTLTAECGESLGGEHTGHYRPLSNLGQSDWHICAACKGWDQ
jgi:hypothetical protein